MSKEEDDALSAGFLEENVEPVEVDESSTDEVAEPVEMIGGMTLEEFNSVVSKAREVDELKSTVAKLRDTFYGRLGGVEQQVKALPKSQIDRLSPNAKERMAEEFPELAEILFGDNESPPPPPPQQEPERVHIPPSPAMNEELTVEQKLEVRLIQRDHKDWVEVLGKKDFQDFLSKKPQEEQDTFGSTWDADIVSGMITEYKDWSKDGDDKVSAAKKAAAEKAKRIKSAITPRGDGVPLGHDTDDEEAAMMQGFSS